MIINSYRSFWWAWYRGWMDVCLGIHQAQEAGRSKQIARTLNKAGVMK